VRSSRCPAHVTGSISVLHEAGALVCDPKGSRPRRKPVRDRGERDLLQGNYFALPATAPPAEHVGDALFTRLFSEFRAETAEFPTGGAPASAVHRGPLRRRFALSSGAERANAVPRVPSSSDRALLSGRRRRVADRASAKATQGRRARQTTDRRYGPSPGPTADELFFRRAIEHAPGQGSRSAALSSANGPRLCVTLSYALSLNGSYHVLLRRSRLRRACGADLAFGLAKMED